MARNPNAFPKKAKLLYGCLACYQVSENADAKCACGDQMEPFLDPAAKVNQKFLRNR